MKQVEPFAKMLLRIEENKKVLPTNIFGRIMKRKSNREAEIQSVRSDANLEYLRTFIDWNIYGIRIKDNFDKAVTFTDKDGNTHTYSLSKILQEATAWQYQNTFALNIMSPVRNYVQGVSGTYFLKGRHFFGNEVSTFPNWVKSITSRYGDNSPFGALMRLFNPYLNQQHLKQADQLSFNSLTSWTSPDNLMYFMEGSDRKIQALTAYGLMQNAVIIDGKVVNALSYLRDTKYSTIYSDNKGNSAKIKEARRQFITDVHSLVKTNGILSRTKVVKGQVVIEGLNDTGTDEEKQARIDGAISDFTNLVQFYTKKASGTNNDHDTLGLKTTIAGRLMLPFRSWIIPTIQARTGKMTLNTQLQDYQWGRWLAYFDAIKGTWKESKAKTIRTLLGFTSRDELVKYALSKYSEVRDMLEQEKRLFKDFMNETEFVDLYLANVQNTVNELRVATALFFTLLSGILAVAPGDDDSVKNLKKFGRLQLDRMSDDFSFYFNPKSFEDIVSNAVPLTSFLINFENYGLNQLEEIGGLLASDKLQDKAHPTKYFVRTVPIAAEFLKYLPLVDPEMAKDWGVRTISTNSIF